tara:strand:+ start:6224 stop:6385 length:162 start_codon:yes stop_codon:yes gene_type:complete
MNSFVANAITEGSQYFNVDNSIGSFLGVLFIIFFLGFTFLFVAWSFGGNLKSS